MGTLTKNLTIPGCLQFVPLLFASMHLVSLSFAHGNRSFQVCLQFKLHSGLLVVIAPH